MQYNLQSITIFWGLVPETSYRGFVSGRQWVTSVSPSLPDESPFQILDPPMNCVAEMSVRQPIGLGIEKPLKRRPPCLDVYSTRFVSTMPRRLTSPMTRAMTSRAAATGGGRCTSTSVTSCTWEVRRRVRDLRASTVTSARSPASSAVSPASCSTTTTGRCSSREPSCRDSSATRSSKDAKVVAYLTVCLSATCLPPT